MRLEAEAEPGSEPEPRGYGPVDAQAPGRQAGVKEIRKGEDQQQVLALAELTRRPPAGIRKPINFLGLGALTKT